MMDKNSFLIEKIATLKAQYPDNIALHCFDEASYHQLSAPMQERLLACMRSGIENPESAMGCYACHSSDYDDLSFFFNKVLARHHHVAEDAAHQSDWHRGKNAPPLDLAQLGLPPLSVRVRVGRNLNGFPLPSAMSESQRLDLEAHMGEVFSLLSQHPTFSGRYYSLSSHSPDHIDNETYNALVRDHLMFKDMADDPYLKSAGIADHWPEGRGCYIADNRRFAIWVGEEDHLRIMCMHVSHDLETVFKHLKQALDVIETQASISFARSSRFGHITSCPTNLGTGMRASLHIALPKLTEKGSDIKLKSLAAPLGLSIRGLGGEHTPIGADGTVDISPKARYCITEAEIMTRLYEGIQTLVDYERNA